MSSLRFVLDVGVTFFTGGAAKALDAGMGMWPVAVISFLPPLPILSLG